MNKTLEARRRRREFLITLSYTIFSILMIIVTTIERWPIFYVPLIAAEVAFIWWSYIQGFQSYLFRSVIVTAATCLNIFLYGIQGENFFVLIPTLCVELVLLSLYEMTRIMDIAVIQTVLLFLYHAVIKGTFAIPETTLERNRLILQAVSLVTLIILCLYRIRHHIQEEDDMVNMEEKVVREQKIKDDFVANTSHELRTPVNTISGMCEILLQKNLPDDIHSGILDIQMTGVELQNIVSDIMDYAALESETLELNPRAYSITSTLNDVMNMTVFENREKQLEIIFDCDPNIPNRLEGDEQQLRRVLNNLVSNAIKFTTEGGVSVRVTYRPEDYGINLIVSVRDTGVGMSMEEQERILRGFYQSDSDRNRANSGMGLGLTLASSLIKKMGGFLTIKSQPGKGSEFTFAIPQKVIDDHPCITIQHPGTIKLVWYYNPSSPITSMRNAFVDNIKHFSDSFGIFSQRATSLEECKRRIAQGQGVRLILGQNEYLGSKEYFDELSEDIPIILIADRSEVSETAQNIHVIYKPYNAIMLAEIINGSEQASQYRRREQKKFIAPSAKILVVDDNLMNLKVVEGLLKKYRVKIVAATSGEEALSLVESQDYDFIFMDHMMPGMDGVECFHYIRDMKGSYFSRVPVIALTANAIAGSREMFLSEGFNEFIAKPIDTAILHEVLLRFIPLEKQIYDDDAVLAAQEVASFAPTSKVEVGASSEGTTSGSSADPFDRMEGFDKATALMYCGTMEDFRELAGVYYESGKKYHGDLQSYLEENDLKNYGILAHSIKSTSKTLGALGLSEIAFGQEKAAKAENLEEVTENHEIFLSSYEDILNQLKDYLNIDDGSDKKPETGAPDHSSPDAEGRLVSGSDGTMDWKTIKAELTHCLESFECKSFEDCISKYRGFVLDGRPLEDALSEVLKKASSFDFDGAIAQLNEMGGQE